MKKRIFLTGSTSYLGTKFKDMYGTNNEVCGIARSDAANPVDLLDFNAVRSMFNEFEPDLILHLAADLGRDYVSSQQIMETVPAITQNLIELAVQAHIPFIFTSTEAVYGGKENEGNYKETDELKPRSLYGAAKVASEQLIKESGLPYLITRGHRYVGINKQFNKPKQFPDTLKALLAGEKVSLDSHKVFTPMFINNACDIFAHYIENESHGQFIMNIGVNKPKTYFDFIRDVTLSFGIAPALLSPDGNEAGWPENSSLNLEKLRESGFPVVNYDEMLKTIANDSK